jgi:chemotaxis protein MotA
VHILIGLIAIVGVLFGSHQLIGQSFGGYLNLSAFVLVGGGPLAICLISYDFRTLFEAARTFGRSIVHGGDADQTELMSDLYKFGRMIREGRAAEAGRFLSAGDTHPLIRDLGGLALQRADADVISDTVATVSYARMQRIKRAEEVILTLGRVAPAMGMTGTVIGMIELLSHMEAFDKLGAGMAIAMVATLYGLILQHAVYTPLSRKIEAYGRRLTVNLRLLERGLCAIATARPLHDLRLLAEQSASESGSGSIEEAA